LSTNTRVNIGCGQTPTAGWRNFDNSLSVQLAKWPRIARLLNFLGLLERTNFDFIKFAQSHKIEFADAARTLPLDSGAVDVVYSCHMLEHLDRQEASRFLKEVLRILRPGGILRLAVPDIRRYVETYNSTGDADGFIASTHMCQPRPQAISTRIKLFVSGPRHHNWMYDGKSLSALLLREGFANPIIIPAGSTTIIDSSGLDLRERWDESVYVETIKPPNSAGVVHE
jgi:predicted SAM-dependent methyltransferase